MLDAPMQLAIDERAHREQRRVAEELKGEENLLRPIHRRSPILGPNDMCRPRGLASASKAIMQPVVTSKSVESNAKQ